MSSLDADDCDVKSEAHFTKKRRLAAQEGSSDAVQAAMPLLVFGHGAGADASSQFTIRWKGLLSSALGSPVHTFDFPHMSNGKRGPPPSMEKLVAAFRSAVEEARQAHPDAAEQGVVLVGKSMGSRVALYLAQTPGTEHLGIIGCVALGYPIRGDNERSALVHRTVLPVLFVQGTRDKIGPIEAVVDAVSKAKGSDSGSSGKKVLHVVENGDHSLAVTKTWQKSKGLSQENVEKDAVDAVASFVRSLLA